MVDRLGVLPIGWAESPIETIFTLYPQEAHGACQILVPAVLHPDKFENPVIIGSAPVPNAANFIGAEDVPDLDTIILPIKTPPLSNSTESPPFRLIKKLFSLLSVFQGVDADWAWVLLRASSPLEEEK